MPDTPSVSAEIRPAFVTVVGKLLPSLLVCRTVSCGMTMRQLVCDTPVGQTGGETAVVVCPISRVLAEAAAGMTPAHASAAALATRVRFICPLNTRSVQQLRVLLQRGRN